MPVAEHPKNEANRIAALHSYHLLDTAFEETFDNFARLAAQVSKCPTALVTLVDEDRQWFKAMVGMEQRETPRSSAFCAHAILDPEHALVVPDATLDARFVDNPLVLGEPNIRFYAGVPLVTTHGYALGTLCLLDYVPRVIDPLALETVQYLAKAVMSTIELRAELAKCTASGGLG